MFVPIILGSDKTTVSVATGHTEYWTIYGSISNIHNNVRRAHGAGLVLISFLLIPKSKSQLLFFSAIFFFSWQGTCKKCSISPILLQAFLHFNFYYFRESTARWDKSRSLSLPWWTLPTCYVGHWIILSQLSGTSSSCWCCTGLVCKVRLFLPCFKSSHWYFCLKMS